MNSIAERHTCIVCGKKRYKKFLNSFEFIGWETPIKKFTSRHYACSYNIGWKRFNETVCFDKLKVIDMKIEIISL